MFDKNVTPLQYQKNTREIENIIQECILISIRESIPTEAIIRAYMDESVEQEEEVIFYVATRGHHADIGGTVPGSTPAYSKHIKEEGILIDNFTLVSKGVFLEEEIYNLLSSGDFPARNIKQNIADLKAQVASAEKNQYRDCS